MVKVMVQVDICTILIYGTGSYNNKRGYDTEILFTKIWIRGIYKDLK